MVVAMVVVAGAEAGGRADAGMGGMAEADMGAAEAGAGVEMQRAAAATAVVRRSGNRSSRLQQQHMLNEWRLRPY